MNKPIAEYAGYTGWENHRKIRIKNFRSLVMDDYIDIKKITLLFGKNGTGKSSFIKAIKFLGDNLFPVTTGQTIYSLNNNIDLGDFREIVFKNDIKKKIEIDFEEYWEKYEVSADNKKKSQIINYKIKTKFDYDTEEKNFNFIKVEDLNNNFFVYIYPHQKNNFDESFIHKFMNKEASTEERSNFTKRIKEREWGIAGYPNKSIQVKRTMSETKTDFSKYFTYLDVLPFFSDRNDLRFSYYNQLAEYLNYTQEEIDTLNYFVNHFIDEIPSLAKKFFNHWYVTPLRERPKNKYKLIGNKFDPKEYYEILYQIDSQINRYNKYYPGNDLDNDLPNFINKHLREFGLGNEIILKKDKGLGSILIKDQQNVEHNLSESSSGLIQILPIIVASYNGLYEYKDYGRFFEDDDSTDVIIIEQPELHLHPALQTKIMDFISNGMGTYIIETHSEHIVRKLQVLIAHGKLNKNRVAIYYFDKDDKTGITTIKEMELEDNGFFKEPWPDGFFDDSYNLAREFNICKEKLMYQNIVVSPLFLNSLSSVEPVKGYFIMYCLVTETFLCDSRKKLLEEYDRVKEEYKLDQNSLLFIESFIRNITLGKIKVIPNIILKIGIN